MLSATMTVSGAWGGRRPWTQRGPILSWQHRTTQVPAQVTMCSERRLGACTLWPPHHTHMGPMQAGPEVSEARATHCLSCSWSSRTAPGTWAGVWGKGG